MQQGAWHSCLPLPIAARLRGSSPAPPASRSARVARSWLSRWSATRWVAHHSKMLCSSPTICHRTERRPRRRHRPRSTCATSALSPRRRGARSRHDTGIHQRHAAGHVGGLLRLLECGSERSRGIAHGSGDAAAAPQTGKVVDGAERLGDAPMRFADGRGEDFSAAEMNCTPPFDGGLPAVNRLVAGSSPARRANNLRGLGDK